MVRINHDVYSWCFNWICDLGCKMKQHKWHKEIKAWADGAEIESAWFDDKYQWSLDVNPEWSEDMLYRIKPQPIPSYKGDPTPTHVKEPQYLYVYYDADKTDFEFWDKTLDEPIGNKDYIGKIKLEE